jgi:hypothetical protein
VTPLFALALTTAAKVALAGGALVGIVALWYILPRRRDPRRTLTQLVIVAMYRWARWWHSLAVGVDRGYLAYRVELRKVRIAPMNEALDAVMPAPEGV